MWMTQFHRISPNRLYQKVKTMFVLIEYTLQSLVISIIKFFFKGSQNDNLQEISGQKDLQYSNARIEDESHFFTYFTVITVACIAGYIGYHNKQKAKILDERIIIFHIRHGFHRSFYVKQSYILIRFRYWRSCWRVADREAVVVDDDRVQPVTENSIVHLKKRSRRNVTPTSLTLYINASRESERGREREYVINFVMSVS